MTTVGLLVGLRRPPHWEDVVRALSGVVEVCYADDPATASVDAWLASSPAAPGLASAVAGGAPVAVITDEPLAGVIRVTTTPGDGVYFPPRGLDAARRVPVSPFVRFRWRRRAGLPETLVVDAADPDLSGDLRPTAFALASVVVAGGEWLVEALAWGAACVTDTESAHAVGAQPGVEVLVARTEAMAAARRLAADHRHAAALGRAGRRLVERRHDTGGAARALRRALGLEQRGGADPQARVAEALDALWTPPGAAIRARASALVATG